MSTIYASASRIAAIAGGITVTADSIAVIDGWPSLVSLIYGKGTRVPRGAQQLVI